MLSGEIYLRLKPYLVVEISSDIVTEHCCQSMRSVYDVLPLRLPAMCWHGKWLRNLETSRWTMWSARPTWDIKYSSQSTLQCFTCVFFPQLIRNVRSRRRIDSSSITAHPVNSDLHTWERSLKCYAKNSTYIYICIYIWRSSLSIWIFYISSTWDWLHHFSQFLFMKIWRKCFLNFSKVGRSVIGWRSR